MDKADQLKQLVGKEAVNSIKDGMVVGIGTGTTVYYLVKELGERVKQGLTIKGVPTSNATAEWAKEFGVPLTDFSEVQELDIAIDGADEVDEQLQLIKGGGGALLREKIVASASKEFVVIVDESKMVQHLGAFALPIEVVPFGWEVTAKQITKLGGEPKRRKSDGKIYVTDNGNYMLDCNFNKITEPEKLHKNLLALAGVVETGLFINMTKKVLVGKEGRVKEVNKA